MAIIGYKYRIDGGPWIDIGLPDPLTYTVEGLEEATEYTFEMVGYDAEDNLVGLSNEAVASTLGTLQTIPSLWAYYESDSYENDLNDGDTITTDWIDLSGNGRDAEVFGNPTFQAGEINALPCLRLNSPSGIDDDFRPPDMSAFSGGTWFLVLKVLSPIEAGGPILGTASSPGNEVAYGYADNTYNVDFGSNEFKFATSTAIDVDEWHCCHGHSKPNDWAMYQNGELIVTDATNTVTFPTAPRLGHNGVATDAFRIDLAAAYFFSDKLTTEQDEIVKEYITNKWGITFA